MENIRNTTRRRINGIAMFWRNWARRKKAVIKRGLRLITLPTEDEVISQGTQLCREYILQRLRADELLSERLELLTAANGLPATAAEQLLAGRGVEKLNVSMAGTPSTAVTKELQAAGTQLELMYPDLYESLTSQLELTLRSEGDARLTFMAVSHYLYKRNITWGKVVAGLALAAALAADCVRQEKPEYVKHVVDAFTTVTKTHTAAWIVQQGGWADVIQACRTSNEAPLLWAFSVIGATIGFSLTLLATVNI